MATQDDPTRYGTISRALHWSMAALMGWQFAGMGAKLAFGREHPLTEALSANHSQIGTVLFVLVLARLVWAFANRRNRPAHGTGLLAKAAVAGHTAIYLLMLLVPLFALVRAWGRERGFAPFGFEIFAPRTPETVVTGAVELGDMFHGELAWIMGALILSHIAMALVHHVVLRDDRLRRMTA